jgi:hypothetical protein
MWSGWSLSESLFWERFQVSCYPVIVAWKVVYPEEPPLLGVVSVPCHEDAINSVLSLESNVIAK